MTTKLVVRLLDAAGLLLGWGAVMAVVRGDGALWAPEGPPLQVAAERAGELATVSIHWADLNVEVRLPFPGGSVEPGMLITVPFEGPMLRVGTPPVDLPAVTVRGQVRVGMPVGVVGSAGG